MNTASRRTTSWLNAVVLALALTACCVLAVLITTRKHAVFDVTATRQHALSPRSQQLLSRLDRDLTLVIAADFQNIDRATRQRTFDVLGQFESASKRLKVQLIDTSDTAGQGKYEQVLRDLAARDKKTIDTASESVASAASRAESLATSIDSIQATLLKIKDQQATAGGKLNTQYLQTQAAVLRVVLQDLRVASRNAAARLTASDPLVPVPAIDKALSDLKKPIAEASRAVTELADAFDSLAKDPRSSESEKAAAGILLPDLRASRDAAGRLASDISAIDLPRVLRIARALQLRSAALLIDDDAKPGSGVGVTAIDTGNLLAAGGQGLDMRARTEDLISGAIATMSSGVHPVVCVVHGAPTRLASVDWPLFQRFSEQLAVRGIEIVEWPVAIEHNIPKSVAADTASRPVVFVTLTAQGGSRESAQGIAAGIAAYAKALNDLVASRRNVLLSVNLSQVPASGSPDPLTECLKPLGIEVDSGKPILQEGKIETRRVAVPLQEVLDPHAAHAISGAITGLPMLFKWPVAITASGTVPGVRVEPIITLPADGTRWSESEWQEFYKVTNQQRGDYTRFSNPPAKDSPRDGVAQGSDWVIAAAIEATPQGQPRQRLVVVGSNGWYLDDLTNLKKEIDGRSVSIYPGNLQLLESSVHWLAGQDDQIMRGAAAASNATIPALSPVQQAWLRWLLIAIMPALALAAGIVYRLLRP